MKVAVVVLLPVVEPGVEVVALATALTMVMVVTSDLMEVALTVSGKLA
tara:strand:- start:1455 stop:1598 length:144 start_codon:yes stop_codon:yes gene_type:complete